MASVAAFAESAGGSERVLGLRPMRDRARLAAETELLAEALRRGRDPGPWCAVGRQPLGDWWRDEAPETDARDDRAPGERLLAVAEWLVAADETRSAWSAAEPRERYPRLAERAGRLPDLHALASRLSSSLLPDGSVSDAASPALARARREVAGGERQIQDHLERWARGFGESSYVTRRGDRFVALVPSAGFPRRRALVHDVSGSGQSLFVEPLELTDENNRLIERRAAAADEERRILNELAAAVRDAREELAALEEVLIHFDSLRARARWAADVSAVAILPGGTELRLVAARHPLLAAGAERDRVVPLDLALGEGGRLLLVSGPNMGGKTVLLKTVGLSVALAHAALPVPAAEGSAVPETDELLADLGDEQSLDRGLSTFAAHLASLAAMVRAAGPRTMVLCDELGAGTDPDQGAALGRALVEHFAKQGTWGVVTTHLGSLKRVAGEVAGAVHGSLEFDMETLRPRFRFIAGIPGASHALTLAERLGLPADLIARARALTSDESRSLERLLADLEERRRATEAERVALVAAREEAERAATQARAQAEEGRRTVTELRRRLTGESEALLARARELWQTVQREARRAEKSKSDAAKVREHLAEVERDHDRLVSDLAAAGRAAGVTPEPAAAPPRLEPGARVRVVDLGLVGEIVQGPDAEGKVVLRRGSFSINTHVSRLVSADEPEGARPAAPRAGGATWEQPEQPAHEVDLRGLDAVEALERLDQGLDRAILSGFTELRVIHGIGQGVLKAAVTRHLGGHPQVASHRTGQVGEGGRGVTVARLR